MSKQTKESQFEKSLRLLKSYLETSTEEERNIIWKSIVGFSGPTIKEYFKNLSKQTDKKPKGLKRSLKYWGKAVVRYAIMGHRQGSTITT